MSAKNERMAGGVGNKGFAYKKPFVLSFYIGMQPRFKSICPAVDRLDFEM